jgi:hypothetical protein
LGIAELREEDSGRLDIKEQIKNPNPEWRKLTSMPACHLNSSDVERRFCRLLPSLPLVCVDCGL